MERRAALRDIETTVRVDFVLTDRFPDPTAVAVDIGGINYVKLHELVELKLAFGTSNWGRLKHLGNVQELIKTLRLPGNLADGFEAGLRAKYRELWEPVDQCGYEELEP